MPGIIAPFVPLCTLLLKGFNSAFYQSTIPTHSVLQSNPSPFHAQNKLRRVRLVLELYICGDIRMNQAMIPHIIYGLAGNRPLLVKLSPQDLVISLLIDSNLMPVGMVAESLFHWWGKCSWACLCIRLPLHVTACCMLVLCSSS